MTTTYYLLFPSKNNLNIRVHLLHFDIFEVLERESFGDALGDVHVSLLHPRLGLAGQDETLLAHLQNDVRAVIVLYYWE